MNTVMTAQTPLGLQSVTEFIHDQLFLLTGIEHDTAAQTVRIPFAKEDRRGISTRWPHVIYRRWTVPVTEHVLLLKSVTTYSVLDRAEIDEYTFNTLEFDAETRTVTLLACEDLVIDFCIGSLDVAILATGRWLGEQNIVTLLGCEITRGRREYAEQILRHPLTVCGKIPETGAKERVFRGGTVVEKTGPRLSSRAAKAALEAAVERIRYLRVVC